MLTRTLRLATLPGCVTLLCALNAQAPQAFLPPAISHSPLAAQPKVEPAPPREKKEVSRLLAVDNRIAKRVNQLRPCVKHRLSRVLSRLPEKVSILVTSAHRTTAEQASLRPTFGIKAKPGTSTHEDGRAVDVNVFVDGERVPPRRHNKVIGKAMALEGFKYLGPSDPVHYSVPKWELDKTAEDVELPVMTMAEAEEAIAHNEALEREETQQATALVNAAAAP
ncbi:MAG: hypothetical protein ACK47B_26640 [Armatimonadota bacterium]